MRRLCLLVAILTFLPAASAAAAELDDLLDRSREASYSAEQAISCSTPEGGQFAVVRIAQQRDEIRVASAVGDDIEVTTGDGGWVLSRRGGVVSSTAVDAQGSEVEPLYSVGDLGGTTVLGRDATAYSLIRDGVKRAELVFDDQTGAMVAATTFNDDGSIYCQRRFISFDPTNPGLRRTTTESAEELELRPWVGSSLPETVAGFELLDLYQDEAGFRFAYYSDGFFSFAVFQTPSTVRLPDASDVEFGGATYRRSFTPGQATYVWESSDGGMALVGDLPPDLHQQVLESLPPPDDNIFRRLWRTLFG